MAEDSQGRGRQRRTRAVLDRVEDGGRAVLHVGEDEGETVEVPAALLPEGASDGDHFVITVAFDRESRAAASERIKSLRERLERRGARPDQKDFKL